MTASPFLAPLFVEARKLNRSLAIVLAFAAPALSNRSPGSLLNVLNQLSIAALS